MINIGIRKQWEVPLFVTTRITQAFDQSTEAMIIRGKATLERSKVYSALKSLSRAVSLYMNDWIVIQPAVSMRPR